MVDEVSQKVVIRRFLAVALVAPLVVAAGAAALVWSWREHLPDPIATHWGAHGPDGFSSLTVVMWIIALAVGGVSAVLALSILPFLRRGGRGPTVRFLGATALWLAVFTGVLLVWSIAIQRGLADAAEAPGLGWAIVVSMVVGAIAAVGGWYAQPAQQANPMFRSAGTPVELVPGETVAWMRSVTMSRGLMAVLIATPVLCALGGAAFLGQGAIEAGWLLIGSAAVLALAVVTMTAFRVSINAKGLTVRSWAGWPRRRIALREIASVEVREVNGLADFGGLGWRMRPDASGVILRNGPAVWVTRREGRGFAVVVDDAAVAAGVLQAFVAREARQPAPLAEEARGEHPPGANREGGAL